MRINIGAALGAAMIAVGLATPSVRGAYRSVQEAPSVPQGRAKQCRLSPLSALPQKEDEKVVGIDGATDRTVGMATPHTTVPGCISTSVLATDTMVIAAIIDTTVDTSNFKLVLLIAPARRLELGQSRPVAPQPEFADGHSLVSATGDKRRDVSLIP